MPKETIYKCYRCRKTIKNIDTIRIVKQEYGVTRWGGHSKVDQYDFCPSCYEILNKWLMKYKRGGR